MANTNYTTVQRYMRLRLCFNDGFTGHALTAPIFGMQLPDVKMSVAPVAGLAQGRIVSISRGSPPPKKR